MSHVHIVARIEVLPDYRQAFLEMAPALVAASRKEAGNLRYDLTVDKTDPHVFMMLETWKSSAAIEEHNGAEHFKKFIAFAEGKMRSVTINLLEQVI